MRQDSFECCPSGNDGAWVIVVTWGHVLRERIPGLTFNSKQDADLWINNESRSWVAHRDRSISKRQWTSASRDQAGGRSEARHMADLNYLSPSDRNETRKIEIQKLRSSIVRLSERLAAASRAPP